ncbi:MAG: hypothetical protein MK111_12160 [Crocosphaera sp.]|uniref:hypothetical protein n=1 Tax=Crocosphaera sp. TaxID=2729996 RepID=UPI00258604C8|nr:hypothetical protein [Crocosphaera sp.]MCH2228071.1 hypothetical protein [Candidatus Caenarcaniphilales bacterium]MCH2245381.1 hypothetical protein [Crocosphaera sp.]
MNNNSIIKLIITLIDVDSDRLEPETIRLLERIEELKRLKVIENVERILEPTSNLSAPSKAGGSHLPGILEIEAEAKQIPRAMISVDQETNLKYEVQLVKKPDDTIIVDFKRYECSDDEFFSMVAKIKNIIIETKV